MKPMRNNGFFDRKLLKFLAVGVLNTLLSAVVMFLLYNLAQFGYWGSSAVSYLLGSVVSYILNKKFTFQNDDAVWKTALKFALNAAICYLLAYSIAQPVIAWLLSSMSLPQSVVEQFAMLAGMALYTLFNYVGQRFFAFREGREKKTEGE